MCSSHSDVDTKNVFCYNESNGISTLDPAFARDLEIMWATNQLFDGLVELDSNQIVIPSIAKSWEISEDGLLYTFHLRDSVYFHASRLFADSTRRKVTAQDFVFSFNRIMDPKLASPGQWIFAKVDFNNQNGFTAKDDSTFCIYLANPFAPFLGMLTMQYCNVVPQEVVEHFGADFRSNPIGTGPFRFAFWYENIALVFHRHNHYWQRDEKGIRLPYLDAVKIDFVKEMNVEFQGLIQGRYDFMSGIHSAFKDELLDQNGNMIPTYAGQIYFRKKPFIKTDYLGILVDSTLEVNQDSPLLNKKVRQAMAISFNSSEMVQHLRNSTVIAADEGFIPPSLKKYSTKQLLFNREKAMSLLSEAGYPGGNGLREITISTTSDYADLIEFIQHQWEQIGIKSKVQVMQGSAFRDATANARLEVFRKSWLADYASAENFFSIFYSSNFCPSGPNYTHFSNATFDNLYEKFCVTNDAKSSNELIEKMDSILTEDVPVIPLYYDQVSHFISNNISGLPTNAVNMLDLKTTIKH